MHIAQHCTIIMSSSFRLVYWIVEVENIAPLHDVARSWKMILRKIVENFYEKVWEPCLTELFLCGGCQAKGLLKTGQVLRRLRDAYNRIETHPHVSDSVASCSQMIHDILILLRS